MQIKLKNQVQDEYGTCTDIRVQKATIQYLNRIQTEKLNKTYLQILDSIQTL